MRKERLDHIMEHNGEEFYFEHLLASCSATGRRKRLYAIVSPKDNYLFFQVIVNDEKNPESFTFRVFEEAVSKYNEII